MPAVPLNYATPRRRRRWGVALAAVAAVGGGAGGYLWKGDDARQRAEAWLEERRMRAAGTAAAEADWRAGTAGVAGWHASGLRADGVQLLLDRDTGLPLVSADVACVATWIELAHDEAYDARVADLIDEYGPPATARPPTPRPAWACTAAAGRSTTAAGVTACSSTSPPTGRSPSCTNDQAGPHLSSRTAMHATRRAGVALSLAACPPAVGCGREERAATKPAAAEAAAAAPAWAAWPTRDGR